MSRELLTIGRLCQIVQLAPARIRELLEQRQVRPELTLNDQPYFDAESALAALRELATLPRVRQPEPMA